MAGCDGLHAQKLLYWFRQSTSKGYGDSDCRMCKIPLSEAWSGNDHRDSLCLDAGDSAMIPILVLIAEALKEAFGLQEYQWAANPHITLHGMSRRRSSYCWHCCIWVWRISIWGQRCLPFWVPEVVQWLKESYGIKTIQEVEKDMENFGITKRIILWEIWRWLELLKLDEGWRMCCMKQASTVWDVQALSLNPYAMPVSCMPWTLMRSAQPYGSTVMSKRLEEFISCCISASVF